MPGGDGFEGGLEPSVGFNPVQLCRLGKRSNASPGSSAFVVTREQRILSCKGNGPSEILHGIAIHLDASVGEKELEGVPAAGDIGMLFAEPGLGRVYAGPTYWPSTFSIGSGFPSRLASNERADQQVRPHSPRPEMPACWPERQVLSGSRLF